MQPGMLFDLGIPPSEQRWWAPFNFWDKTTGEQTVYQRWPPPPEDAAAFNQTASGNQDFRMVYHGAPWYAAGNIMKNSFLGSNDKELGHRILNNRPGTYVTPNKPCGRGLGYCLAFVS